MASLFILAMFSLIGCEKDNNEDSTPKYELRFTSTSDNPYKIEVAGNSDVIQGHSYKSYNLEKNTYSWKVTQQSGYVVYPTIKEGTVTLDG